MYKSGFPTKIEPPKLQGISYLERERGGEKERLGLVDVFVIPKIPGNAGHNNLYIIKLNLGICLRLLYLYKITVEAA